MGKHGIANDKVANVDGVERTEKETYLSHGGGVREARHKRSDSLSLLIVLVTADDLNMTQLVAFKGVDFSHLGGSGNNL